MHTAPDVLTTCGQWQGFANRQWPKPMLRPNKIFYQREYPIFVRSLGSFNRCSCIENPPSKQVSMRWDPNANLMVSVKCLSFDYPAYLNPPADCTGSSSIAVLVGRQSAVITAMCGWMYEHKKVYRDISLWYPPDVPLCFLTMGKIFTSSGFSPQYIMFHQQKKNELFGGSLFFFFFLIFSLFLPFGNF